MLPDELRAGRAVLAYRGLDGVVRRTQLAFDPPPDPASADRRELAACDLAAGRGAAHLSSDVRCERDGGDRPRRAVARAPTASRRPSAASPSAAPGPPSCTTSNESFNDWLQRSRADLDMLMTETPHGPLSLCRHSLVLDRLRPRRPDHRAANACGSIRRWPPGRLRFLAAHQATALDPAADAEPGKILHETREGEMATLGEVPFARYYGSVDSTPLFVMLAAAYYERTGDLELIRALWPNIEAALAWMRDYGDLDGDGFLEYDRKSLERADQPGLEGQRRRDLPRRRQPGRGADRAGRGPGLCLCRLSRRRRAGARRSAAPAEAGELEAAAEQLKRALRGGLLARGARHLRAGARRRQAALPGARLQCRPCAAGRARLAERAARVADDADGAAMLFRLGHPHARRGRGALQSDVLSQRLGLAARQRPDRHGPRALRAEAAAAAPAAPACSMPRSSSSAAACPSCSAALPGDGAHGADRLSGGLLAAGLGVGGGVRDARRRARHLLRAAGAQIRFTRPVLPPWLDVLRIATCGSARPRSICCCAAAARMSRSPCCGATGPIEIVLTG